MSRENGRSSYNNIISIVRRLNLGRVPRIYQKIFLGILCGGMHSGGSDADRKLYRAWLFRPFLENFVGNGILYGKYPCIDSWTPI